MEEAPGVRAVVTACSALNVRADW